MNSKVSIANGLLQLAQQFPTSKLIWCNEVYHEDINFKKLDSLFHHNKMMLSYSPSVKSYLGDSIGYVEDSPFININKKVRYPTWQMSSDVGIIHAKVLITFGHKINANSDFDYFLNSVAKIGMPLGLLCYSEPELLYSKTISLATNKANSYALFQFVKQHYKARWILLLLLNLLIYDKYFFLLPFLVASLFKSRKKIDICLEKIRVQSIIQVVDIGTVDVIIPTIGRKQYLYDVLKDLAKQTILPKNVIIVEQNQINKSVSELDYLKSETWPFIIKHTFIHQAGACNARNVALNKVESEWVFLADDDIRIDENLIQKVLENIEKNGINAVSLNCFHKNEKQVYKTIFQWGSFGSGCSFVLSDHLKKCKFNMGFEFGYGEDSDFGMQLRNYGVDILYMSYPKIFHLRAPIGGFREKLELLWHKELLQPKPSPTVMLYKILNCTREQLLGYKTTLFFKYYKDQQIRNPVYYLFHYKKQWEVSILWANELKKKV